MNYARSAKSGYKRSKTLRSGARPKEVAVEKEPREPLSPEPRAEVMDATNSDSSEPDSMADNSEEPASEAA